MSIFELFLTACGLSMDAFAVSVTNGLCVRKGRVRGALMCGIIFGLFQGIMPAIGYALGMNFAEYIERFDHWIALILLGFIGLNMIYGSGVDEILTGGRLTFGAVLVQGFATSVDALAVGISFAALGVGKSGRRRLYVLLRRPYRSVGLCLVTNSAENSKARQG